MDTLPRQGSLGSAELASTQDAEFIPSSQVQTLQKKGSTPGPGSIHISSRPIESNQSLKRESDPKTKAPANMNLYNTAYQSTAHKRYAHHKKFRPDIRNIADQD